VSGSLTRGGARSAVLQQGQYYGAVERRQHVCGLVLSEIRHGRALRMPRHAHERAFFSFLLAGSYQERHGGRDVSLLPPGGMFRSPAVCHRDEIGRDGARFFNVELEPNWIERLHDHAALPAAGVEFKGGELSWLGLRLYRELAARDEGSSLIIEGLVLELLGTLLRRQETAETRYPGWLRQVTDRLHAEYAGRLKVSDLAATAGVHPVHLARVFRRFHGTSPGEYVQKLRVQAVCSELARPVTSLAEAALAAGFADQSHCTRVFKKLIGTTPAAFRTRLGK
jgi:AraC family transcriptional regulator